MNENSSSNSEVKSTNTNNEGETLIHAESLIIKFELINEETKLVNIKQLPQFILTIKDLKKYVYPNFPVNFTLNINGVLLQNDQLLKDIQWSDGYCIKVEKLNQTMDRPRLQQQIALIFEIRRQQQEEQMRILQEYQEAQMGGCPEFSFGLIAGFFFHFFGVLLVSLCNFPKRAKIGALIGLIARIFYYQLQTVQQV